MLDITPFFMKEIHIINIEVTPEKIYLYAEATKDSSSCPRCNNPSYKIHSKYYRTLKELPILGCSVEIKILCRKFFCDNSGCIRKVFTERFSSLIKPYGRRTNRLNEFLTHLAFSASSNSMSKTLNKLSITVSKNTLIRIIRSYSISTIEDAEYLGVDDFAFRKNHNYGTLICDLLSHEPIDLLPDRKSETLKKWLDSHTRVELVTRDRSGAYAKAVKDSNKDAIQIADRFHICHNLLDRVKDFLKRVMPSKLVLEIESEKLTSIAQNLANEISNISLIDSEKEERKNRKRELIKTVKSLHSQGNSQWEISRITGLSRKTVRKYIQRDEDKIVTYTRAKKASILDKYKEVIKSCIDKNIKGTEIFQELKSKGYRGSYSTITKYIRNFKKEEGVTSNSNTTKHKTISRYNITNYMWKNDYELEENELNDLKLAFESKPIIEKMYSYIQKFRDIFKSKKLKKFDLWLKEATGSKIKELESFCNGIIKDYDAVMNSLKYEYSNGLLEGQVNRLKYIKRQMYGRANFDLLKKRVLYRN